MANNGWETFLSYEDPEQGVASWRCGIVAVHEYKLLTASDVFGWFHQVSEIHIGHRSSRS